MSEEEEFNQEKRRFLDTCYKAQARGIETLDGMYVLYNDLSARVSRLESDFDQFSVERDKSRISVEQRLDSIDKKLSIIGEKVSEVGWVATVKSWFNRISTYLLIALLLSIIFAPMFGVQRQTLFKWLVLHFG